jgi:hypothetical protein
MGVVLLLLLIGCWPAYGEVRRAFYISTADGPTTFCWLNQLQCSLPNGTITSGPALHSIKLWGVMTGQGGPWHPITAGAIATLLGSNADNLCSADIWVCLKSFITNYNTITNMVRKGESKRGGDVCLAEGKGGVCHFGGKGHLV